jgi:hypothetical protein
MSGLDHRNSLGPRRDFLRRISAGVAGGALAWQTTHRPLPAEEPSPPAAPQPLPTIKLGPHTITRLVAGSNPVGGHSHTTIHMSNHMRAYFTLERTVEFLEKCEREGINCWQFSGKGKEAQAARLARDRGGNLKYIILHAQRPAIDDPIEQVVKEIQPIALVHHGNVTDSLFAAGRERQVHDFIKRVHDAGVMAGVSAHNPENIKRIADAGWENDLFMCCFYYVTRPREEQLRLCGKVTVGEPFFESDPDDMTKVMRAVQKPCLGFKILAAGRLCWSKFGVEQAFKFAFEHIKPTDGVIVGMMPEFSDEVRANCDYARKYGVPG